jgi:DtxR family transcriptional regulator, Mn-dependent transcriptional regulator
MPTSTVENYVKQIFLLQPPSGSPANRLVAMGDLAAALRVVPGTATSMIKTLAEAGLADYEPRAGVRLTERGERLALHVLRRHRLVELFLVRILGMDWSEIHDEAEQLEHFISERVLERIDSLLGHPKVDPHGDTIPDATGTVPERVLMPLAALTVGQRAQVGRIADQADAFLQFIDLHDLRPGRGVCILERDPQAGIVRVLLDDGREITLGQAAAAKIEVELAAAAP